MRLLCEVAEDLGIDPGKCLANTGVDRAALNVPATRVSTGQEVQAIENFVRLAPADVGLGVAVGKRMHVNAFGIWGFAVISSPTLRSGIETAIENARLSLVIADMKFGERADKACLEFDLTGLPLTTHRYIVERHSVVTMTFIREVIQEPDFQGFEIEMTDDDAGYAQELSELIGASVKGAMADNAILFPKTLLDDPLPKADPATWQYCLDQCKSLLEQIDGALPPWSQKVRDAVVDSIGTDQKIEDIAQKLAVTERTLRRRLTDEGTSFRDLYTDARMTLARELLATAGLNVETVAWRVGYSEPASFVRAFSKKFGKTPGEIRKERAHPRKD